MAKAVLLDAASVAAVVAAVGYTNKAQALIDVLGADPLTVTVYDSGDNVIATGARDAADLSTSGAFLPAGVLTGATVAGGTPAYVIITGTGGAFIRGAVGAGEVFTVDVSPIDADADVTISLGLGSATPPDPGEEVTGAYFLPANTFASDTTAERNATVLVGRGKASGGGLQTTWDMVDVPEAGIESLDEASAIRFKRATTLGYDTFFFDIDAADSLSADNDRHAIIEANDGQSIPLNTDFWICAAFKSYDLSGSSDTQTLLAIRYVPDGSDTETAAVFEVIQVGNLIACVLRSNTVSPVVSGNTGQVASFELTGVDASAGMNYITIRAKLSHDTGDAPFFRCWHQQDDGPTTQMINVSAPCFFNNSNTPTVQLGPRKTGAWTVLTERVFHSHGMVILPNDTGYTTDTLVAILRGTTGGASSLPFALSACRWHFGPDAAFSAHNTASTGCALHSQMATGYQVYSTPTWSGIPAGTYYGIASLLSGIADTGWLDNQRPGDDGLNKFTPVTRNGMPAWRLRMRKGQRLDAFRTDRFQIRADTSNTGVRVPHGETFLKLLAIQMPEELYGGQGLLCGQSTSVEGESGIYVYMNASGGRIVISAAVNPQPSTTVTNRTQYFRAIGSITVDPGDYVTLVTRAKCHYDAAQSPFTQIWASVNGGTPVVVASDAGANAWNQPSTGQWSSGYEGFLYVWEGSDLWGGRPVNDELTMHHFGGLTIAEASANDATYLDLIAEGNRRMGVA